MATSWHPKPMKHRCHLRKSILSKLLGLLKGKYVFVFFWFDVEHQIDQQPVKKTKSRWEGILALIFDGFWWEVEKENRAKIEYKSIPTGIETIAFPRRLPPPYFLMD